jgi:hypothetical protein
MHRIAVGALLCALLFAGPARADADCSYDAGAMLALGEDAFDQDLANGGGWRALERKPGCQAAAAELIAAYRAAHPNASTTLAWHEGQLRASAGQDAQAIALFELARHPADKDKAGWNLYVDASIAFLRHDREALLAARDALAKVAFQGGEGMPPLKDGYLEFPAEAGQPAMKVRWPPNLDVVEGFLNCFESSYDEAYGAACRTRAESKAAAAPATR